MCGKRHAIEAERQCRRADRVAARGEDRRVVPKLGCTGKKTPGLSWTVGADVLVHEHH